MISMRKTLSATAIAALMSTGVLVATAAPAAARVICNAEGDCWHTDAAPPRVPGIRLEIHPDTWYFRQKWDADKNRHYREHHDDRGYYKGGVWIRL